MLARPMCLYRECKHFIGVKQIDEQDDESLEWVCEAFPDGIPNDIAFGDNKHTEPRTGQANKIVYEKE